MANGIKHVWRIYRDAGVRCKAAATAKASVMKPEGENVAKISNRKSNGDNGWHQRK
jgi:hypothetical protein